MPQKNEITREIKKPAKFLYFTGLEEEVVMDGIEPPTQGFSVLCSTD